MYICVCKGLTESDIKKILDENNITKITQLYSLIDFNSYCQGKSCCRCLKDINQLLKEIR